MPYLSELIGLVNESIRSRSLTDQRFSGAKLEGIAYPVARTNEGDAIEVIPAIVELNKVERYIGVDDTYPLIIYHRILSNNYAEDGKASQYGDGLQAQQCTTNVVMIVFGKRSALKLTTEQLEALIVAGFPDQFIQGSLDGLQLFSAKVTLQSSNLDALSVFGQEYKNMKFFLGPEDILFSINYKVESRYKKNCFKICDPCE